MGWTFLHRDRGLTTAEFFSREWRTLNLKATATKAGAFYAVAEVEADKEPRLIPDANGKVRLCLVVLLKHAKGEYNFGYKEMDEFCGPVESRCPARLLDMLSPIKDDAGEMGKWAAEWRARSRAAASRFANRLKLVDGMSVKLPEPVTFKNGAKIDTFFVSMRTGRGGRKVPRFVNGSYTYQLPKRLQEKLTDINRE